MWEGVRLLLRVGAGVRRYSVTSAEQGEERVRKRSFDDAAPLPRVTAAVLRRAATHRASPSRVLQSLEARFCLLRRSNSCSSSALPRGNVFLARGLLDATATRLSRRHTRRASCTHTPTLDSPSRIQHVTPSSAVGVSTAAER